MSAISSEDDRQSLTVYHPLALSDDSVRQVLEEIRIFEVAVASVDAEMQELFRQAAILRAKKQKYLDLIAKCRGRITLALRAPDELLALIFEHCASDWIKAPLTLSQVCRKWRQAAMTPSVWSRVPLTSESKDPVLKTKLWLDRALDAPLRVLVDIEGVDDQMLSSWNLLLDRSAQWQTLEFHTRTILQANALLSACDRPLPRLRFARILCPETPTAADEFFPPEAREITKLETAFGDAPALRHLAVHACHFPPSYPSQITRLTLNLSLLSAPTTPIAELEPLVALTGLPHLTNLTIHAPISHYFNRAIIDEEIPVIEFSRLESFTLDAYRAFNPLLKYIRAPSLRILRLRSIEDPLTHPHAPTAAALLSFLTDSTPPLQRLELHDVDLPAADYCRVFAATPCLEALRLHETEIPDETLATLNGPRGLCPRLRQLDLRWCEQLAGTALVDLVQSRLDGAEQDDSSCPIESVRIINCAMVKERDVLDLARMTTCSVYLANIEDEAEEYCRSKGCCNNARYRQRMMLRHHKEIFGDIETKPLDLILD
ncbi:hypothetical protein PENSPDRAFT_748541 [Peniophora sp. CONT]|nr:hypothetical protein PENSPDRAFT_748541 [Peniophora sp. CONT]